MVKSREFGPISNALKVLGSEFMSKIVESIQKFPEFSQKNVANCTCVKNDKISKFDDGSTWNLTDV